MIITIFRAGHEVREKAEFKPRPSHPQRHSLSIAPWEKLSPVRVRGAHVFTDAATPGATVRQELCHSNHLLIYLSQTLCNRVLTNGDEYP